MDAYKKEQGMTLLELLIVLSIIVMSVAILWPVIYPQDGNQRSCYMNMKDLGMAIYQYEQDHNGMPPLNSYSVNHRLISWRVLLLRYISNRKTFECPTNLMKSMPDNDHDSINRSYALNACRKSKNKFGGPYEGTKINPIGKLISPENTILMVETTSGEPGFDILNPKKYGVHSSFGTTNGSLSVTHNSKSNFLFADGHLELLSPYATLYKKDSKVNMWTCDNAPFTRDDYLTALKTIHYVQTNVISQ